MMRQDYWFKILFLGVFIFFQIRLSAISLTNPRDSLKNSFKVYLDVAIGETYLTKNIFYYDEPIYHKNVVAYSVGLSFGRQITSNAFGEGLTIFAGLRYSRQGGWPIALYGANGLVERVVGYERLQLLDFPINLNYLFNARNQKFNVGGSFGYKYIIKAKYDDYDNWFTRLMPYAGLSLDYHFARCPFMESVGFTFQQTLQRTATSGYNNFRYSLILLSLKFGLKK